MSNFVNLLDIVYPIGSVYISFNRISPVDSVGSTWSQITDKVLRAANDTSTGGSDVQSHNFDHNHYMSMNWAAQYNFQVVRNVTGINVHDGDYVSALEAILTSLSSAPSTSQKGPGANSKWDDVGKPLSTVTWSNLPAYQNCYVWRRTA